jgi:hypothetical protein
LANKFLRPSEGIDLLNVAVPLLGQNPTLDERTQTYQCTVQKDCSIERLLVSKVGPGTLTGQIFVGSELSITEPFDAELVGSPTAFGIRFNEPALVLKAGTTVRVVFAWKPGPWTCLMTVKEWARRANKNSWGAKVDYAGKRYNLRIQGHQAPVQLVDAAMYKRVVKNRLGVVPGFTPVLQLTAMFLARVKG